MATFEMIRQKLEFFIRKYYTNELIRGVLLFLAIGLLYFLSTLLIEYYLWLNSSKRKILFWAFIVVEAVLFIRFIVFPLLKLFRLRKGINYDDASRIIGKHFPEVNDKLLNLIQLNRSKEKSDLLLAGIEQKSADLQPVPFSNAVQFKQNIKYLKYVAIPVVIFLLYTTVGDRAAFTGSYERVVNYDVAYEPPAPFSFVILNEDLQAIENQSYTLKIKTEGKIFPENVSILYENQSYFLEKTDLNEFQYEFRQISEPVTFRLHSNKVKSSEYILDVVQTPSIADFQMELAFPKHTGMQNRTLKSTGNAVIPEGTKVTWKLETKNTEIISLESGDSLYSFLKTKNHFELEERVFRNLDYTISTSNNHLKNYESLSYSIEAIKDQYPEINLESKKDSTSLERMLFLGRVSDDYGLTGLQLVYYPVGEDENSQKEEIPVNRSTFDEFTFEFPGNVQLKEGKTYEFYFEVFDNDAIHNFKSTRSGIYSFRKLTKDEIEHEQLEKHRETVQNMNQSLKEMQENKDRLEELSRTQKEKSELNYNDKKRLEEFLKRQHKQEELMKNFSKQLKDELEDFQEDREGDHFKEELEKRLEENEKRSKENEKLLEELEKIQDKIRQEDLIQKLDQMSQERKKQERNLEQLVELTKRYYVEKKAEKIAEELQKLGDRQEELADKDEGGNTEQAQQELNDAFNKLMEELDRLREDNQELKNPMDFLDDDPLEDEIRMDQQDATDQLQDGNLKEAGKNQKSAGSKMKQKGRMMQDEMQSGSMEMLMEDIDLLRRILTNVVRFSFEQEDLMIEFRNIDFGNPVFGQKLRVQNELKSNFEHIDDSIYTLSVRQPMIGDQINSILTDMDYHLSSSLENFAENQKAQAVGNQQYVMKGSNDLAVLLNDILNNLQNQMQMQMSGGDGEGAPMPGGSGGKFQLPDIIQQQQSLMEQMSGSGEDGNEGEEGDPGEDGGEESEGTSGNGNEGDDGKSGDSGTGGNDGEGQDYWNNEGMSEEVFEIYKQQQKIRQELEDLLKREGLDGKAGKLLKDIQNIENRLLSQGLNTDILRMMELLKYELLKLDQAHYQQGEEERREATTNRKEFKNPGLMNSEEIKRYFQTTEILNRENLPLRGIYKVRVQEYFKNRHD